MTSGHSSAIMGRLSAEQYDDEADDDANPQQQLSASRRYLSDSDILLPSAPFSRLKSLNFSNNKVM